jgi:hypothetical protein
MLDMIACATCVYMLLHGGWRSPSQNEGFSDWYPAYYLHGIIKTMQPGAPPYELLRTKTTFSFRFLLHSSPLFTHFITTNTLGFLLATN